MEHHDIIAEIEAWEHQHLAAATKRAFNTKRVHKANGAYTCPRKAKTKEYRCKGRGRYSGAKKVLKKIRNSKVRWWPVDADGFTSPSEFRRIAIDLWAYL